MKRKHRKKMRLYFLFFAVCSFTVLILHSLDHRLEPSLKEISHIQCRMLANQIIDDAADKILSEMYGEQMLFFTPVTDGYTIDTMKVNHFCTNFSRRISSDLKMIEDEKINIPLGAVTGWSLLANTGPPIPFTLLPEGAAKVDYATDFTSVGINQINYKIWINIAMEIKVVNPLYHETILLERKMMLADIIFSGKVPDHFFQLSSPKEYLLTE